MRAVWRSLRASPGYTLLVLATLALAVGVNTALFSVANAVLLRPLPYRDANRLAAVYSSTAGIAHATVRYPNFLDWQRQSQSFSSLAIYRYEAYTLTGAGAPEHVSAEMVSSGFFGTLGVQPRLGRFFTASDDHLGAAPVAVVSSGLWQRQFGGAPDIAGRTVDLGGSPYTVVGVVPASFNFYGPARDVFLPIGAWSEPTFRDRKVDLSAHAVGRLRPGTTLAQAQQEMNAIAARLAAQYPVADKDTGIALVSLREDLTGNVRPLVLLLLAAVGFLLLIASVNVANLMLARATHRSREFAIRAALGAGTARLAREVLGESLALAALGGIAGVALAALARKFFAALVPATLPGGGAIPLDWRVLAFAAGVCVLAGLLAGAAPALKARRAAVAHALRAGSSQASGRSRAQAAFVVVQVALAFLLLVGAGLMLRTMSALLELKPGYDPGHALTFFLALPPTPNITSAQTRARLRAFDAALSRLPGVEAESVTLGSRPMIHDSSLPFWVVGRAKPASQNEMPQALFYLAGSGYARAMGLHLEQGRFITDADNEHSARVVVIDDVFARLHFPGQDPIGQHIHIVGFDVQAEVVGVVGHVLQWGLQPSSPTAIQAQFYYPFLQLPEALMPLAASAVAVIVRTQGDPRALLPSVRGLVPKVDPREILYGATTLDQLLASTVAERRATLWMLAVFGSLALALAALGIYAALFYRVARRTREIGIRVALGSRASGVAALVLADTARMCGAGLALGLGAGLALTRLMSGLLYGVRPADPRTFAAVAAMLVLVAFAAALFPARRALAVDPLVALKAE
ncbi:MAG TPA: ABC transporter permease [Terriglobales bacterium]|nr:ABC transporter permease [Terriglobales bacterium]